MAECENSSNVTKPVDSDAETVKISELLDGGWKLFEEVDTTNEALGSNAVQVKVRRGISMLEEASRMVAQLDLFSRNEGLEEVASSELKYLLLPALLGALTLKLTSRDKRLDNVQTAGAYFRDFLQRCKEYHVSEFDLPKPRSDTAAPDEESDHGSSPTKPPDLVAMAAQRQAKIERYRQRKETEARLSEVRASVESGQADEEVVRDYYLLSVRRWVSVSLEEVDSIEQEVEILKRMDTGRPPSQSKQPARTPMKPFILTKDAVQARVFGAGYPSLPTVTVDEWYEQHRKHGALPDQGIARRDAAEQDVGPKEHEDEEEERAEQDSEESLQKARDWDDWKDTHRRGYGNRHNMG